MAPPLLFFCSFVLNFTRRAFSCPISMLCGAVGAWSLIGARLRSPWPRARPPACDSTVSTNAFRAELHAFSGVSQAAASADCNQIQSGIKRRS